ncbi:hypothetical protein FI667_g14367, partial [Globisporangium splendens]
MYSQSMQKRVEKQKEHANKNLTSWFMKKFSKKTQYLRDQDEETAQAERARRHNGNGATSNLSAKPRHISAVTNQRNSRSDSEQSRPNPQRQRSFLRAQLLEMKRESAETLLQTQQKRMAGERIDEVPRFGTQLGLDASDEDYEDYDESEDDDLDSVHAVDEIDDALVELTTDEYKAIRKEKWQLKQQRLIDAAADAHKMDRRRSSASSATVGDDEDHDKENEQAAVELNRRISRATELYAQAINQIEHALHPEDHPPPVPEPQPLFLGSGGGKKGSNRVKSEWI